MFRENVIRGGAIWRAVSRLRVRLFLFNALVVFLPVAGVLFLDTYEHQLLGDQERAMFEQGRVLAAALGGEGRLDAEHARRVIVALDRRTGARLRLVDTRGRVLADSSAFGPRRERGHTASVDVSERSGWLYRLGAWPFRVYRALAPPESPHGSADIYTSGGPFTGPEIAAALAGHYGSATRISAGGQRSVTLYSALPIRHEGTVVGAVLVSQSTYRVLQALYRVRLDTLRVFLASLAAAAVLSLLVSRTIARPLRRLRDTAEEVLDTSGQRVRCFGAQSRADEIGDLARSLEALRVRLVDRLDAVESFASDVSHELKNPLASVRSATEMCVALDDPVERAHFARIAEREIARMERLLAVVRDLGRLDAGIELERERIELNGFCGGLVDALAARGTKLELERAPAPVEVDASPDAMVQVLTNLIENALDFGRPGEPVEVAVAGDRGHARISVRDCGPGVPPSHRERVFERFFSDRADAARSGSEHAGLGLAIASGLVAAQGGRLDVEDANPGARFVVTLPRVP